MKNCWGLHLLFLLLFCFKSTNPAFAQESSLPVLKLKELYQTDEAFKTKIRAMLEGVQPLEDGSENPWKNKTIEDLYSFLDKWFYFLPNTHNGLDRIIEFSLLWYKNPAGEKFILTEPGLGWSLYFIEERGKFMDSKASMVNIEDWLSDPTIGNEDFETPAAGFKSFNEFFTRGLKPGVRPISNPEDASVLVSPADGVINMIANDLELTTALPTKAEMTLSLERLLDNSEYAEKFVGGTALAVFLMPTNYHHYHAPVGGKVIEAKESVGDRLFGLPDIIDAVNEGNPGYNKDYSVFQDFRHGYFILETEGYGYVGMVPIGLQTIGSVVFEEPFKKVTDQAPKDVIKGQKLGHFAYGGSTVLLLFEPERLASVSVLQGQRIGEMRKK